MPSVAETYRLTKKTPDLLWNEYVCRPIAAVFVVALSGSRVTPNQVTLASLVVAVVAAGLLVRLPGHAGLVLAVVVYEASYVLDCVDGMLARLRNVQSVPGHLFDATHAALIADETVLAAMLEKNREATAAISARLRDALDRGLWPTRRNSVAAELDRVMARARA